MPALQHLARLEQVPHYAASPSLGFRHAASVSAGRPHWLSFATVADLESRHHDRHGHSRMPGASTAGDLEAKFVPFSSGWAPYKLAAYHSRQHAHKDAFANLLTCTQELMHRHQPAALKPELPDVLCLGRSINTDLRSWQKRQHISSEA